MRRWNHRDTLSPLLLALLVLGVTLGSAAGAATKIYRSVDEHGNVVFTDVPPKGDKAGQPVDLDPPNSFSAPERNADGQSLEAWLGDGEPSAEDGEDQAASPAGYATVRIVQPADDAALRDNAGNLRVVAATEPELQQGHALALYLDGALLQSSPGTTFQLNNIDRGTHSLQVQVIDGAGNSLAASEPVTFHLQRRSVILQPARAPGN